MRLTTILILAFAATALTACGGGGADDVEVVLPFVGNVLAKGKTREAKMENRGTLVLPPSAKTLPEPLTEEQLAKNQGWVADPDVLARKKAKLAELKEKKYRREGDWAGERNTGNGLEDFNKKVDWSKRQTGILQNGILKQD